MDDREAAANSHLVWGRLVYSAQLKPELMARSGAPYLGTATWPLAGDGSCLRGLQTQTKLSASRLSAHLLLLVIHQVGQVQKLNRHNKQGHCELSLCQPEGRLRSPFSSGSPTLGKDHPTKRGCALC